MRNLCFLLLTAFLSLTACTKVGNFAEPVFQRNNPLNGEYKGTLTIDRKNTINNMSIGWTDTVELQFLIEFPAFKHGSCIGNVTVQSDNISFDGNDCGCWCGCDPLVDCMGDRLLGTKQFSFDGDSLLMWETIGGIDSLRIPKCHSGYYYSIFYRLKKL